MKLPLPPFYKPSLFLPPSLSPFFIPSFTLSLPPFFISSLSNLYLSLSFQYNIRLSSRFFPLCLLPLHISSFLPPLSLPPSLLLLPLSFLTPFHPPFFLYTFFLFSLPPALTSFCIYFYHQLTFFVPSFLRSSPLISSHLLLNFILTYTSSLSLVFIPFSPSSYTFFPTTIIIHLSVHSFSSTSLLCSVTCTIIPYFEVDTTVLSTFISPYCDTVFLTFYP